MASPGDRYRATTGFDRLNEAAAMNARVGAHLWILITTYGLTDEEAANAFEGVEQLLDGAHLLATTPIGCFMCEGLYEDVAGKPCAGEPRR